MKLYIAGAIMVTAAAVTMRAPSVQAASAKPPWHRSDRRSRSLAAPVPKCPFAYVHIDRWDTVYVEVIMPRPLRPCLLDISSR